MGCGTFIGVLLVIVFPFVVDFLTLVSGFGSLAYTVPSVADSISAFFQDEQFHSSSSLFADMDKKSLFWWYGHTLVETDLKQLFHGGEHAEI
ncbi:MAG: hypothetical protein WCI20_14415 [bacterium]